MATAPSRSQPQSAPAGPAPRSANPNSKTNYVPSGASSAAPTPSPAPAGVDLAGIMAELEMLKARVAQLEASRAPDAPRRDSAVGVTSQAQRQATVRAAQSLVPITYEEAFEAIGGQAATTA